MSDTEKKMIIGEFLASFLASLFGLGLVMPLSALGLITSLTEFAIWFGIVYALVIVAFGPISGAHCNTGITLACALFAGFPKKLVLPYIIVQILGWGLGVVPVYLIWSYATAVLGAVPESALALGVAAGSVDLNAIIGCTVTIPGNEAATFFIEFLGTALLTWAVFLLLDPRFPGRVPDQFFAVAIGAVIACCIVFTAGFSGGCLNFARDLGTRLVHFVMGLINGQDVAYLFTNFQWVIFLIAPTLGSLFAAWFQFNVIAALLPEAPAAEAVEE